MIGIKVKNMSRQIFAVNAVQRIGEQIGYANLMGIASALWRRKLIKAHGVESANCAFVPVLSAHIKEDRIEMVQSCNDRDDKIVAAVLGE